MKNNLSSDILEQQFGPTEVEILYQDTKSRVICTKVVSNGQTLELSHVEFMQPGITAFAEVHHAIIAGQSMGKAFRTHKVAFVREIQSVWHSTMPNVFSHQFGGTDPATVVLVDIFVGTDRLPYAHILETYSPNVLWPDPSREPTDKQIAMIRRFSEFLKTLRM